MLTNIMLVVCVLAISIGQILFKVAAGTNAHGSFLMKLMQPSLLLALFIYGAATVFWIWLLQTVPLNVAYPYMALAFLFVPLMSLFFLGEKVELSTWIGSVLIVIGVFFHAR